MMTFGGRFSDSLLDGELHALSVSFLVDDLDVFRGGVAGNVCFGLAQFGLRPVLVAAVGHDFSDYAAWLERHGVDLRGVHVVEDRHTARFICTTDSQANQIASFYPGAMSEADQIELEPIVTAVGGVDLVVVAPNAPQAMQRHTEECRQRGYPFVADPSQQLAFLGGHEIRSLIEGARYLLTNEYEAALIEKKTGLAADEVLALVGTRVTTLGPEGSRIERVGADPVAVPCVPGLRVVDPTGMGDAFRAGYLAGLAWGLADQRCAELGSLLAAEVLQTRGTQEYTVDRDLLLSRCEATYGAAARDEISKVIVA